MDHYGLKITEVQQASRLLSSTPVLSFEVFDQNNEMQRLDIWL
jgi:hypothetical protein